MTAETIFALASGAGRAGVAVMRVSGPEAGAALRAVAGRDLPAARRMMRVRLRDPKTGEALDDGLAVWFPAPASFTGEDVVEFHIHGARTVIAALTTALGALAGCRLAQPGEFTRRAFEAGKLDLTEAEGLADLIDAETEAQRKQALRQMQGELGRLYDDWRGRLIRALAHLEATIDFSDEELPEGLLAGVRSDVAAVAAAMTSHLADGRRGERLRDGVHLAILGPPNAGKSSLLNMLARREAAIVSDLAGTTRDVVEVYLDLGGYPLVVADTAGLRAGGDAIEREGVRRARLRAEDADLKLVVLDGGRWPAIDAEAATLIDARTLVAVNKIDLKRPPMDATVGGHPIHALSVKTGEGVDDLLKALATAVAACCDVAGAPALTRARHREALEECRAGLRRYLDREGVGIELAAEELRLAVRALGRITGRVGVEDVLDVVFRDFCIGK